MNMLALTWGETTIVVDAGVMFPDPELLGVDRIIPDLTYLQQKGACRRARADARPRGSHRRRAARRCRYVDGPDLRHAADARARRAEAARARPRATRSSCVPVRPRDRVTVGPFTIEFIRVTHSMPDCVALAIHTPVGVIVHTGDFKIDQTPIDGEHFDVHRFAQLGVGRRAGALRRQHEHRPPRLHRIGNRGRRGVRGDLHQRDRPARSSRRSRRASTGCRSWWISRRSSTARWRSSAAGMIENSQIAQRLGYLRIPAGVQIRDSDVAELSRAGRPVPGDRLAGRADVGALAHRDRRPPLRQAADPTTPWCSRRGPIPGNEKAIGRVINHIARRGADVIHEGIKHVHVSGHGSEEELKLMLSLVRPRYFVPVHGEYRQLVAARARRRPRVRRPRAEARDPARRERRPAAVRRRRAPASPARRRSAAC